MTSPRAFGETRPTMSTVNSKGQLNMTSAAATLTIEQRGTKSAQKLLLSPSQSKSNIKATKTHRLTAYNSFKVGSSTAIKSHPGKQNKFELPALHSRSNSKQNPVFNSTGKVKEPQMMISKSGTTSLVVTQSHNFLPAKQVVNGSIQTVNAPATCPNTAPHSLSASKQGSLS